MKTKFFGNTIALIVMALVLMGCPYTSTVPISEPTVAVPDTFIGTWERKDSEGEKTEVKRTGPNTFDVIQPGMEEGSSTVYKGFFSEVNGQLFMNVKEGDFKITLKEVTPYIRETFESSTQLRTFIEKNMQNSYFFTTEESSYYKIK